MIIIPRLPTHMEDTSPEVEDTRVRKTPDEVLQGLAGGKFFHCLGETYAVGPGNLQYSLDTLLELESQGLVEVQYNDKVLKHQEVVSHIASVVADGPNVDEDGIEGNDISKIVSWHLGSKK